MSRQASAQKRAVRMQLAEARLRADLDQLRAVTADCYDSRCYCHWREWREISVIQGLLGESPTVFRVEI